MVLVLSANKNYSERKNIKIIDKVCNLSDIKKKTIETLIIDECLVNDDGSITINENIIYLDEILIVKRVKNIVVTNNIIYFNEKSKNKLIDLADYYKIGIMFLN